MLYVRVSFSSEAPAEKSELSEVYTMTSPTSMAAIRTAAITTAGLSDSFSTKISCLR